jgi:RNA polymerase sigma-70 factor (ECF subfamily)
MSLVSHKLRTRVRGEQPLAALRRKLRFLVANTERNLAERVAKHDSKAFAELYKRYVDRIYRYIYFKSGRTDDAEDLTAQVFLKAWEAVTSYRWEGYPFSTWLYRIAHNQVIDYYRTHREHLPLDTAQTREGGIDPLEAAQLTFTAIKVQAALRHLTSDQERVITLRFLEGYSTKEVAAIMRKDADSVRALQHRGLRALQSWVGEENPLSRPRKRRAAAVA